MRPVMRDPDLQLWYDINEAEDAFVAEAEHRAELPDLDDEDDDRCPACERYNCSGRCCL
jgi:hypothetical protein